MSGLTCVAAEITSYAVTAYTLILFVYAVVSWFPGARGRWVGVLASLVEPVLAPVRRIIPPIGGLDIAFLVVIVLLQFVVRPLVNSALLNSCIPY